MIIVRLYGGLAKTFGKSYRFDVRTPAEAIRALQANFPSFKSKLEEFGANGYHIVCDRKDRDVDGLKWPVERELKIVPAVAGASAGVRIVIGAMLIVAGILASSSGSPNLGIFLISTGVSMVAGGVAEIMFPMPKPEGYEPIENRPSFAFDGPLNTVAQGNPVPICYGRMIVGSQVVSASMEAGEIPAWA